MATLTVQNVSRSGLRVDNALVAANGGGDQFLPDKDTYLEVNNGSGGAITVTIATPGTVAGLAVADVAVSVPAGQRYRIGPFPAEHFAQPDDGLADITYSGVTSLTIGAFKTSQP
jgi:hypothetical protein